MPIVSVDKEKFFNSLKKKLNSEEFEDLCFDFGIELDEDTSETCAENERAQLKIEVPANRYDLLCLEGLLKALNEFLGLATVPEYKLKKVENMISLKVNKNTSTVRQYISAAILRNIKFDEYSYQSFISLQEKLHGSICRDRVLVAIGTHDLDKIKAPFLYDACLPEDIKFVPLNQKKQMNGKELMDFYSTDKNIGKYLHIIKDSPFYPVVYDSEKKVCSLPPIINSNYSKIELDTKNVFIEVTGTDRVKTNITLNQVALLFSKYSSHPFEVEPVNIISDHNNASFISPDIKSRKLPVSLSYINSCLDLNLDVSAARRLLTRMSYTFFDHPDKDILGVIVSPLRSDVLSSCDVLEDVAIAYGYNNLKKSDVKIELQTPVPNSINLVSDILRLQSAQSGYTELMTLTMNSLDENFKFMKLDSNSPSAVYLQNPKTIEYQVVRDSLIPGILKSIAKNKDHPQPIKVFEVGDVVLRNDSLERAAYNQRNWTSIYAGKSSGFEHLQGLLTKIMASMGIIWLENNIRNLSKKKGFWLEPSENYPYFFPSRAADIHVRLTEKSDSFIAGKIGVLHPLVLKNFDIPFAASALEVLLDVFF